MTIEAIKAAISELSEEECSSLASWLIEKGYDRWDREMVVDFSPGGRAAQSSLNKFSVKIAEGQTSSMTEGFSQRHKRA
jgi:hypothetical protein